VLAGGTLITPSPKELLAGIGVFIFPIIYLFLVKIKDKNHSAALWWLVVSIGLSYSPLPFARMYLRDIFFPLALLFTIFLSQLNQANTRHRILAVFLILLSVASSVYIFSIRAANSFVPIKLLSQSYITKDQKDALDFLKRKTEANSTVLSLMPTANIIPPKTANKVPAGHTYNTVGFKTKYSQIESFYKGDLPIPAMSNFLQKHKITYIYLGEEEAKLAPAKALETFNSNFTQIYSNRTIKIYRYTTTTPPNAN
jgi:hypothetical protein